jgi:hypothetical protein
MGVVSVASPQPKLDVRGESTISAWVVAPRTAEAGEAANAFAADVDGIGNENEDRTPADGAGGKGEGDAVGRGGGGGSADDGDDCDDDNAIQAVGSKLAQHTAPVRAPTDTVGVAWTAAAGRAEHHAASSGLGDGRADFSAASWGGTSITAVAAATATHDPAVKAPGRGGASLAPLATSKPTLNLPQQLSWPWRDVAAARMGAAGDRDHDPDAGAPPPAVKRRVNMLKPLGGGGAGSNKTGERRDRMRTAMDGRMEVLQRHLLGELDRRRADVDALAKAPLGSAAEGQAGAAAARIHAWATGGSLPDGEGGDRSAATEPMPPLDSARGMGPGQAPSRSRKLREQRRGGGNGGGGGVGEAKRDEATPELGWVRRLVSFVDSSPIYVPQDGASSTEFTEDRQWEQTVFPSLKPNRREDIQLLERWLEAMLADLSIELPKVPRRGGEGGAAAAEELGEAALWVYRVAFEEIRRQVELQCRDRAALLTRVWDHFFLLVELRSGMRYEDQLSEIHRDRHALKVAMDEKDAEKTRLREELDAIDDRHRDELLAAERSRASLARQMVELERKAKEEHVRALESNKKLLEEIGVRLHREDTIARLRKEAEAARAVQEATDKDRRDEKAAKERASAAHRDATEDLGQARNLIEELRQQISILGASKLEMGSAVAEKSAQLENERLAVTNLGASLREAIAKANAAKNAEVLATAQCEAKERQRAGFEAVHSDLEAELLAVRKSKGKIDVMYQKLVTEHTAAMERMKTLEDTVEHERETRESSVAADSHERDSLKARIVELEEAVASTEARVEAEHVRAAALALEINDVRTLAKELASGIRSQAELARGILPDDIPVGIVDPRNVTGLPESVRTDLGKGKELMKRVVLRLRESKRTFDDLVRVREVARIQLEAEEEARTRAELDLYQEKLRNESQART